MSELTDRLRGKYPMGEAGEFGVRTFFVPPISIEAADRIDALEGLLDELWAMNCGLTTEKESRDLSQNIFNKIRGFSRGEKE